ncbi:Coproporphyrinogen III oxidase [Kosakonia oryzae]|uniref:Coproporphyrinogen III oxidase n=1 Tax=Kosakonia oryzae TaxID=497725 RepID=A0AA94H2D3_9ENTR|nr:Coproporphyrinogen III oxidase [Kosakonia oryzae]
MNDILLDSLNDLDPRYPVPQVYDFLASPENRDILEYVYRDPFGCHVFPGDIKDYPLEAYFQDMAHDIAQAKQIHLWVSIPTCRYRCHFCQFPTIILNPQSAPSQAVFRQLVDYNIKEATLWLDKVPTLAGAEVGEFNIFGGTPSLLPAAELQRLMAFYQQHFNLSAATLRFEGEPATLTKSYLERLKTLGFSKISFGVQSFNNDIIAACGRRHTAETCEQTIANAREVGFDWISIDLIYGLPGQSVDDVKYDMEKCRELAISHVVCTKLHLAEFMKQRTGVSGQRQSLWQKKGANSEAFPGLGKQYQMRELIERYLAADYREHPTMYFHRNTQHAEKWKGLITDLDKQYPEVAIGLGGSSKCSLAEAINITDYRRYKAVLDEGQLPIDSSQGFSPLQREVNAFKMALSTLRPVCNHEFRKRFDGRSFFSNPFICRALKTLTSKTLLTVRDDVVTLTPNGVTLVEAIINTQFSSGDSRRLPVTNTDVSAPVFSLYYIAIDTEAGVTNAQFEEFVREKGCKIPCYPGWRWTLLRGLRGERAGQFMMLYEIESAECRDRYQRADGNLTPLARQFWRDRPQAQAILREWQRLGTFSALPTLYTDYRLLAENKKSTVTEGPRYRERPGEEAEARVIGIHNLALRPDVKAQDFETFIAENHHRIEDYPDWKFRLLKGERGNRLDQYVVMMEIASLVALDQFYPQPDIATDEAAIFARAHRDTKQMYEEWKQLASFSGSPQIYTDYLAVAESQPDEENRGV